ncbi:efflux RND transporter periplasmic adaptor subunit [Chitinophaga rhizophila]|uniref:Efflux RND transporter periplasmic adaptor subunit n=1 Tax=Chitinophaga rhizophila TaxID=2866212 RepID=A0ABS7GGN1_9BACT|nr:efflux RND transporter periplasmic adaptor subunit [Chitinophaga rhizophila]MBW8686846.1 efflux RND transporter periplasmic adaptor subunit [Chitinophaga rhizophila]
MKPTFSNLLLASFSGLIISCGAPSAAENTLDTKSADIPVKLLPLNGQLNAHPAIAVSGQFTTDDEVLLSFKTGGIIQRMLVKEGDAVKQGQLLAILNPVEINAQVQQAQLGLEKAQRDYQRVDNLYKDSVATLEQLQNAKTALDMAGEQHKTAQFNLVHSRITATANGYVLRKLASEGQLVQPGTPVLETNGAQSGNWLLRVKVSNREWAAINVQDKASVEVEAVPGKTFHGHVSRKSEGVQPQSGSFTADITLTGEKPAAIAFGMFGKAVITPVTVTSTAANGPWAIPYDALLEGDGNTGYVFITNDSKTAHRIPVTIAGMESDKVIISNGLQQAAALIISGSAYLTEGSTITVK